MSNAVVHNGYEGAGGRPTRQPRWTPQDLRVLIEGKKAAEIRRTHHMGSSAPEPKWVTVSSYCRRRGVNRCPRQCRKKWDNLARDYKRIKAWECRWRAGGGEESFWAMRNERRRDRMLPGFFDREVYDMLDGAPEAGREDEEEPGRRGVAAAPPGEKEEERALVLFDSGRTAAEDGLFSDLEEDEEEGEEEEGEEEEEERAAAPPTIAMPISGMGNEEHPAKNTEKGSSPREAHKRKRPLSEESSEDHLQSQLMEILERNSRTLAAHLEAQNVNWQLERDQRKDHTDRLLGVLSKLADAVGRIADKLSIDGAAKV